ncbi:LytR/AlgR family response regulator transcription factor [Fluviicola chungangensis]|uniref:Response regulator transcription factor n=1 Tax=Fluviicola chungangensis TaxID=2597671 RepID=A0A556MP93_9FLAO|nr:LytTR family transcriptional regulator DNA-binding domain-containing protein [Fluviicola chungangensis]TSJ41618.1 response regulator transcription factor [Fluviicola chungangensis]
MTKPTIFIVEDEPIIADFLAQCLSDEGFECLGIADSFEDTKKQLMHHIPDLFLLDINLGLGPDGVDLAHFINQQINKPFLFVTSNTDPQTLERVKLTNPSGFVMKPFKKLELVTQIELAWYAYQVRMSNNQVDFANSVLANTHFFIKDKQKLIKLAYSDITYAEACDNYSILHTNDSKFIVSYSLKHVEAKLPVQEFLRVHRSYMINITQISQINPKSLVLIDGKEIPVSEAHRSELLKRVNLF